MTRVNLRQRLQRNTLLADIFCRADEGVARAQTRLEAAATERARTLAALAVTLGSDAATARLLGLPKYQIRAARKAIGRQGARDAARHFLQNGEAALASISRDETPAVSTHPVAQDPPADMSAGTSAADTYHWSVSDDDYLLCGWLAGTPFHELVRRMNQPADAVLGRIQTLSMAQERHYIDSSSEQPVTQEMVVPLQQRGRHRRPRTGNLRVCV